MSQHVDQIEIFDGLIRFRGGRGDVLADIDHDEHKVFAPLVEVRDAWRKYYAEERAYYADVAEYGPDLGGEA